MNSTPDTEVAPTRTLVVGANLTGLFLSHRLHLAGHQVQLVEAREALGGRYLRANKEAPYASPGLDFMPANADQIDLVKWLQNRAPIAVHYSVKEHKPQVYDEGKWRPFAGFGESHFKSVDELSSLFNHPESLTLEPGLEHVVRGLIEQLPFAADTLSTVTGFKVKDGKVAEVVLNGEKILTPDQIVFTPNPVQLNSLFEGEELPVKHRTRLAKMATWTVVTLELEHESPLTEDDSIRIFTHSAKEFEPVVGRVNGTRSKWITVVDREHEADHEFIGQCIRHIKRQLKRAWPQILDGKVPEKIYIQPQAYGQHSLRGKETYRFNEISNLYLAGHALAGIPGELGLLATVQGLEALLCGPLNRLPELSASC